MTIDDEKYQLFYKHIREFSMETLIKYSYGIEDILIDECTLAKDYIIHELVFVGEKSWKIKCEELIINKVMLDELYL